MRVGMCCVTVLAMGCATSGSADPNDGIRPVGQTPIQTAGSTGRTGSLARQSGDSHVLYTTSDLGIETTVPVPVDSAYVAMRRGYGSLGVDLLTSDDAAHVIGNKHIVVMHQMLGRRASDFFDCGIDGAIGGPRADRYRLTVSVVSTLASSGKGQTRVTTRASAVGEDLATSASSVYCSSTGLMERILVKAAGLQQS